MNIIINTLSTHHRYTIPIIQSASNSNTNTNSNNNIELLSQLKRRIRSNDFESNLAQRINNNNNIDLDNIDSDDIAIDNNSEFDQLIPQPQQPQQQQQQQSNITSDDNIPIEFNYRLKSYPVLIDTVIIAASALYNNNNNPIIKGQYRYRYNIYYKYLIESIIILLSTLLLSACAQLSFYLPISWSNYLELTYQVPITFQTFAVLLLGSLLGWRRSIAFTILYALLILAGAPFASTGTGGYRVLLGGNSGFIIGFIPASGLVGLLASKGWDRQWSKCALSMTIGNLIIYIFGLLYLPFGVSYIQNKSISELFCNHSHGCIGNILYAGMIPFLPGDALKIILAMIILPVTWRLANKLYKRSQSSSNQDNSNNYYQTGIESEIILQ